MRQAIVVLLCAAAATLSGCAAGPLVVGALMADHASDAVTATKPARTSPSIRQPVAPPPGPALATTSPSGRPTVAISRFDVDYAGGTPGIDPDILSREAQDRVTAILRDLFYAELKTRGVDVVEWQRAAETVLRPAEPTAPPPIAAARAHATPDSVLAVKLRVRVEGSRIIIEPEGVETVVAEPVVAQPSPRQALTPATAATADAPRGKTPEEYEAALREAIAGIAHSKIDQLVRARR